MGMGAAELVAGGLIAYSGLLVLLAVAVLGLALLLRPWLAALIVGIVVVLIGAGLALKGRRGVKPDNLARDRTLRSLCDDADWRGSRCDE